MSEMFPEPIYRHGVMRTTKAWRLRKGRYRLLGSRCKSCGRTWWPGRKVCGTCNSRDLEDYQFNHIGELVVHHYGPMVWHLDPIQGFGVYGLDRILAVVKLEGEEDTYIAPTDVVDCEPDKVQNGMRLRMTFRKLRREPNGNWNYGFMWTPLKPNGDSQ